MKGTRKDSVWRSREMGATAVLLLLLLLLTSLAAAQTGYHLDWWTVDAGGGTASGGSYALEGTIGQPDAGLSVGGVYSLSGGFWTAAAGPTQLLFLPAVVR